MTPRIPRTLVRWLAAREDRAVIIGDLDEGFAQRSATSPARARAWYWSQAFASLPAAIGLRWRRAALMADLGGDVRRALRLLRRQPGFAAAAIVTMALGAGSTTGVVSVVEAVLLRPLPYANGNRVAVLQEIDSVRRGGSMSWSDYLDLSARLHAFAAIAGYSGGSRTLTGEGAPERLPAIEVTPTFFDVLGVRPAMGRGFVPSDAVRGAAPVVVISDGAWMRRLGSDPAAVGRTITLSGVPHTIIGVLPATFVFPPRADPELWCLGALGAGLGLVLGSWAVTTFSAVTLNAAARGETDRWSAYGSARRKRAGADSRRRGRLRRSVPGDGGPDPGNRRPRGARRHTRRDCPPRARVRRHASSHGIGGGRRADGGRGAGASKPVVRRDTARSSVAGGRRGAARRRHADGVRDTRVARSAAARHDGAAQRIGRSIPNFTTPQRPINSQLPSSKTWKNGNWKVGSSLGVAEL